MVRYSRRGNLAGPVLLIGFGTLVLLINLGLLPVSLWVALSLLWPLALIAIGLDLLIPRRSVLGSVLVAALLLLVVFAGAGLALPALTRAPAMVAGEPVAVPATGDPSLDVSINAGAGTIWLKALSGDTLAISGKVSLPGGARLEQSVERAGGTTTVELKSAGVGQFPFAFGRGELWDLALAEGPDLRLTSQMGAGEMHLDARRLNLAALEANIGAGTIDVSLPQGQSTVKLSLAMGQILLRVPRGTPVELRASTLGGNVAVPAGYTMVDDVYRSPGFTPGDHIVVDASLVFGSISVIEQ